MNSFLWIEIDAKQKSRFLLKCFKCKIPIYETYEEKNCFFFRILDKDYAKIKKFWFIKAKVKEETGFLKIKKEILHHHIFLIALLLGIFFLFFLSHMIVDVKVVHSNKEIRELLEAALQEKGIKKNSLRKSYEEIEQIKKEILNQYPSKLEWIEIERTGMKYIVRVEERKIENKEEEKTSCHIVATKDGIIKDLIYSKGVSLVKVNDVVKKGDILISGIIKKDEEERNIVCASGNVFAEVWYQVSASVPMEYEELIKTGKKRYNIRFQNSYYDDFIFKSRLNQYVEEKKEFLNVLGQRFFLVTQYEVRSEKKKYTESEALERALNEVLEKINSTLSEKEEIIDKKVLKKEINNSTMNIEVFVALKESIGEVQEFVKEMENE